MSYSKHHCHMKKQWFYFMLKFCFLRRIANPFDQLKFSDVLYAKIDTCHVTNRETVTTKDILNYRVNVDHRKIKPNIDEQSGHTVVSIPSKQSAGSTKRKDG